MERRFLSGAAAVVLAAVISACGGGGDENTSSSFGDQFPAPTAAPDGAQQGGDLNVLAAGDVDYIDPGAAYYQFSYMIDSATQRQLRVVAARRRRQSPTPDIAADEPQVSSDGLTITWKLKPGIKFSPPVEPRRSSATTSSTRSSGRCCPASPMASSAPT